jgi:hypothetical protein
MDGPRKLASGVEIKVFDPRDSATGSDGAELLDASVVNRAGQWWMYLAGQAHGFGPTDIYSATLPPGVPLSAKGWRLTRNPAGEVEPVAGRSFSASWDGKGGRHCPSYVKGWDPLEAAWVERIYYAGAAENLWGPYMVGFLQWDGKQWVDQLEPVFVATEAWERGSVYEPNLIYHDGKWKLWYVAGSNQEDYLVQGYAESEDGSTGWSKHEIFAPPEMKMFDFCVRQRGNTFDAIFSRICVKGTPPPETGLWWCRARTPSAKLSDWNSPVQIMPAEDRGWHSGPWKPSFQFDGAHVDEFQRRAFVFFDGLYRTSDPGPFPFAFTLGCLEIDLPGDFAFT